MGIEIHIPFAQSPFSSVDHAGPTGFSTENGSYLLALYHRILQYPIGPSYKSELYSTNLPRSKNPLLHSLSWFVGGSGGGSGVRNE